MRSVLRRLRDQLTHSAQELDAEQLQTRCDDLGTTQISQVQDRAMVEVSGTVRNLTVPSRGQVPALAAELFDGSGALSVVWLGRREIHGIECGVYLRAYGRVSMRRGMPTIFNPSYEILPRGARGPHGD
ncbi:MAG: OB-fold nucleic acid binding domain-containing protein [Micrococcales bacterium]|nr:OB-fold nucleic acid binding domain-containing protein [Micrococcales bacterium]